MPFPFTDFSAKKTRPVPVVSDRTHNDVSGDLLVCGMTSNLANSPASVLVEQADLRSGRLAAPSRVKVARIVTFHHSLVRKQGGILGDEPMRQVLKEIQSLFRG
ncbi:MAG: type II toxin-antitoxin system PemK/MazF family toxin [Thermoplasmatota archaeon]